MNKPNTDYRLRMPGDDEIKQAFGTIADYMRVTGGDLPTVLLYLANPDRIEGAPTVPKQPGDFADRLSEIALTERALEAWEKVPKKTVTAVATELKVDRSVARRGLVNAGKWPVPA